MALVLIVDDNAQSAYMLRTLLRGHGYRVESAENGAEALAAAARERPDLVISDILMPVMDGFALCRAWKGDEALRAIPFVFYTATYTDPKDEQLALGMGAARFIVKPSEPDRFMAAISWRSWRSTDGVSFRSARANSPPRRNTSASTTPC